MREHSGRIRYGRTAQLLRRQQRFLDGLTFGKAANMATGLVEFARGREVMRAWPALLKVDISPLCNLHCTICVHARPDESSNEELKGQRFHQGDRMSVDDFARIMAEVSGHTALASLYYLGDPLMHPHLAEICAAAAAHRVNTHVSTNFSFGLTDERIDALVASGLTHMTVCVDGMTQDSYGRTRVGGRIDLVLSNLRRVLESRARQGRRYPRVEVQYVKYQHNLDELDELRRLCASLGVDSLSTIWGGLHNYTDRSPGDEMGTPRPRKRLPRCTWPFFGMVVKFDGDVIPCCVHRLGAQYAEGGDARVVGNALRDGVLATWNSADYRLLRQLARDPSAYRAQHGESFCAGCSRIYAGAAKVRYISAARNRWEDFYELDAQGRAVRLPTPPVVKVHDDHNPSGSETARR